MKISRMLLQQVLLAFCLLAQASSAFLPSPSLTFWTSTSHQRDTTRTAKSSTTELSMVFDFFRERSKEGIDQLNKFTSSASRGEIGKGLADIAAYTQATNKAFADGLAKSRVRLLQNLESLLTGVSPEELLEELTDILLQADLGLTTAEDIVAEVKSLREDSTKMLSQDDLRSIMRGKIIEALESTGKSNSITFAEEGSQVPTVLFVMGANGMGKTTT